MTEKNIIKKLEKKIEDLKNLLEIEKSINLHKCPKIDLKEGDYFTVVPKKDSVYHRIGDRSYIDDVFSFIKEDKVNPQRTLIIGKRMQREFQSNEINFVPCTLLNGPILFLTTEWNIYKYQQ